MASAPKPPDAGLPPATKEVPEEQPTIKQGRTPQLTHGHVKALPTPIGKRVDHWFGEGFGVRVTPNGTKTFVYAYRLKGQSRKRWLWLGVFDDDTTLKQATDRHDDARRLVKRGIDPMQLAEEEKAKAEAAKAAEVAALAKPSAPTFRQVFDHWKRVELKYQPGPRETRSGRQDDGAKVEASFKRHVFPRFGDMPIREVDTPAVLELVVDDTKVRDGKQRTAAILFGDLKQMFDFALERKYIDRSPLAGVKKYRKVGAAVRKQRYLNNAEITQFLRALPTVDLHAVTQLALLFILITGQRPGDVAGMPKTELNDDRSMWTIPAERYKNKDVMQQVPLSEQARRVLREADRYNTGSAWVFPSPSNKPATLAGDDAIDNHVEVRSLSKAVLRKLKPTKGKPLGELGIAKFTPHDLRRTCRTGMAALGVPDFVAEKVIGHVLDGILAVYNRHDYMRERRAALEAWGEHLDSLA